MRYSDTIGGYFALESTSGQSYYANLISLNTGRNAFEYILRANQYKHVYVPYFFCDVLLEPINKLNLSFEFYNINDRLEPVELPEIKKEDAFLYINYFGLKNEYVQKLAAIVPNLVIDNSQAFFSLPLRGKDVFYSPRKFFGLPDGAYLSTDKLLPDNFEKDISFERCSHLLIRLDVGPEDGYSAFQRNEASLKNQPIKAMSDLTSALLKDIDYDYCAKRRNENFNFLHSLLDEVNEFEWIDKISINGPMIYPFKSNRNGLRERLIENKVYVACYWPNVQNWADKQSLEVNFSKNILPLPVDHRYGIEEMKRIVDVIYG